MIDILKTKFEASDYMVVPGNKVIIKSEELLSIGHKTFSLDDYLINN